MPIPPRISSSQPPVQVASESEKSSDPPPRLLLPTRKMTIVGLTGGIGSGKSAVSNLFNAQKIPVVDADIVARDVLKKNVRGYKEVFAAVGPEILGEDCEVDRPKFGQIVFSDDSKRQLLNSATWTPHVRRRATYSKLDLPEEFLDFLRENGIDPSIYTAIDSSPRYIRLKPGCEDEVQSIEAEIECQLERVDWLSGFYSLPPHIQIAGSRAYREGKIYGIDASSGASVCALNISKGDHVLDLCAAPGAKLCMLLDLLGNSGSVTGIDVARHRLAACRTMLQKYSIGDRCRLFVADGTKFSLGPTRGGATSGLCNQSGESAVDNKIGVFGEWTSRRSWKERKNADRAQSRASTASLCENPELIFYGCHSGVVGLTKNELYKTLSDFEFSRCGYDKVLVDAECTHDGSIKHIHKFEDWGWSTLQQRVLNADRTDSLNALQLKLLSNGFRLLKAGGLLVYSTCSLTIAQNEDVVGKFLNENPSAALLEIEEAKGWPCKDGRMHKTLRFDPSTSQTSGLFVAKFTKSPSFWN